MQYDPKKVMIIVDGFTITGFAEDSFITASRMTEKRTSHVGCHGEVTFSKSADDRGEVRIKIKHTSPANEKLMNLYLSDKEFDFACVDQNFSGDVGVSGSSCVVQNYPDFERGKEVVEREWTLIVADYEEAFKGVL